jgi:hypothetical protein
MSVSRCTNVQQEPETRDQIVESRGQRADSRQLTAGKRKNREKGKGKKAYNGLGLPANVPARPHGARINPQLLNTISFFGRRQRPNSKE